MTRVVLVLVLATLAGCGGGDDGAGGGGAAPTKQRFVADANRICREGERKAVAVVEQQKQKLQAAQGSGNQAQALADVLEDTAREYRPYLDRLRALRPPTELAADWKTFIGGVEEAFGLISEVADATRAGDKQKLSDLTTRFSQIAGQTRPFAQSNGLDDCLPDSGTQ